MPDVAGTPQDGTLPPLPATPTPSVADQDPGRYGRRHRRMGLHAGRPAALGTRFDALADLDDFVRWQGRIPTSEPTVELIYPSWGPHWYASVETSEIPSDPCPFPPMSILKRRAR